MIRYFIKVGFDDRTAGVAESKTYFNAADKYNAGAIGNDRIGASTLIISTEKPLDLTLLANDLPNIPILSVTNTRESWKEIYKSLA